LTLALEFSVTAPLLDIVYVPDALPTASSDLAYLTAQVVWLDHLRARRTASFGAPYNYSGQVYPAREMPPPIAAIGDRAAALAGHAFNNCLCNRYDSGANRMGFHSDSYDGLVPSSRIAIASFGAARTLVFRSIDKLHRSEVVLEHGSILLMTRATQLAWKHAVLPDATAGLRISATYRLVASPE
jgi:alkylated DNA repair dioxygenase AlkB